MAASNSSFADTCSAAFPVFVGDYLGFCPSISITMHPVKVFVIEMIAAPILNLANGTPL